MLFALKNNMIAKMGIFFLHQVNIKDILGNSASWVILHRFFLSVDKKILKKNRRGMPSDLIKLRPDCSKSLQK